MPLAEVKEFVQLCLQGDATIPARHQIIQNQVLKVEADLAAMDRRINTLRRKANYYSALLKDHMEDACNPMSEARTKGQTAATEKPTPSVPA